MHTANAAGLGEANMLTRKRLLGSRWLQAGAAIAMAGTCFAAFGAAPMPAEQRHVGEHASVISEERVSINLLTAVSALIT